MVTVAEVIVRRMDWGVDGERLALGALGGLCGFIAFAVMGCVFIFNDFNTTLVKDSEVELSALKDGGGSTSGIYVGTGSQNGGQYGGQYYYYKVDSAKGKSIGTVSVNSAYIKGVAPGTKATLVTYKMKRDSGIAGFIYGKHLLGREYIFNIPDGELTTDVTVDME